MNVNLNVGGEHSDDGANSCEHGQSQGRANSVDGVLHAHGHTRQGVVIKQVILRKSLVELVNIAWLVGLAFLLHVNAFLTDGKQHVLQSFWHLCALLGECIVDAGELFGLRETIVAGDDMVEQITIEIANVAQVDGQLEGEGVAVAANRLL